MKQFNLSFLSGLTAFVLLLIPIFTNVTLAGDDQPEDTTDGKSARDDVYVASVPDQVYNAVTNEIYNSVTGDVYYYYDFNRVTADMYYDGSNVVVNDVRRANFPTSVLEGLSDGTNLIFDHNDTTLSIPVNALEYDKGANDFVTFSITEVYHYHYFDALSNVIDLNIYNTNWQSKVQLGEPISITFQVNPDEVTNWDNLVLRYTHPSGEDIKSKQQIRSINKETGQVVAEINHMNTYAIDEVEDNRSVTDRVYYEFNTETDLAEYEDENGDIYAENANSAYFEEDVVEGLTDGKSVTLTNGEMKLSIPTNVIKEITSGYSNVWVGIDNVSYFYPNALSSVFAFNILLDEMSPYTRNFSEPVEVTFQVDPAEVRNWDDLVLRYIDQDGNAKNYKNQFESVNKQTGEVVANVYHFSEYGIFEVPGSGAEEKDDAPDKAPDSESKPDSNTGSNPESNESGQEDPPSDNVKIEEKGVTGHVYFDQQNIEEYKDLNGDISVQDANIVTFLKSALDTYEDGKTISLSKDDVTLRIPSNELKEIGAGHARLDVMLENVTDKHDGALSSVFDFGIYLDLTEKYEEDFAESFEATFYVDPSNVNNWDNLVLRYIDDAANIIDYPDHIISVNKETGEVVAKISHFSTYGIYEVSGNDVAAASTENDGEILPNTATNLYNYLLIGAVLLLAGLVILLIKGRKATKA
ncbi:LPXTG cell wall anchor domain-containing protein [Oceanobacillus halotolerans]|uniref:LPXTG cell wall anchor domain-containing protein n=1 Tax=Oceanobacillus halotolerans TaxID=2663380 RepID=UPI0013DCB246|nr:LPXTG cell wall anchor domain-containing protein [Oceanobacillus halotolerans]